MSDTTLTQTSDFILTDTHITTARAQEGEELRVFIADVAPKQLPPAVYADRMDELNNLVDTYGGIVVLEKIQKKDNPDYRTYLGKGKLEEVIEDMKKLGAHILIIGNILKPSQLYNINEQLKPLNMQARDRVDLILKIFDKHAEGKEARLQIELASIKHMGPRIFGMSMELGKQGSGAGARGQGETNTEVMKRHLSKRVRAINDKLKEFEQNRALIRESRKKKYLPTAGLVWYTNAGKSSILNTLTNKGVLAEDKLFATLGTSVGKFWVQKDPASYQGTEILVNDTIGFIRELPPKLIKAFTSTLEDSIESDILLHVIDAGDERVDAKIKVVNDILKHIGANQKQILIFNKIDTTDSWTLEKLKTRYAGNEMVFVSAHTGEGIDALKQMIVDQI